MSCLVFCRVLSGLVWPCLVMSCLLFCQCRELNGLKEEAGARYAKCQKLEDEMAELRAAYTLASQKSIKFELENRKYLSEVTALKNQNVRVGLDDVMYHRASIASYGFPMFVGG
jgi:hypothetical protein